MRARLVLRNARVLATLVVAVAIVSSANLAHASVPVSPPNSSAYGAPVIVTGAPASPQEAVEFLGKLYFSAEDANGDRRLYSFDGATFTVVDNQVIDPVDLTVAGEALYYSGTTTNGDSVLYWFDGSSVDSLGISATDTGRTIAAYGNQLMVANPESDALRLYLLEETGGLTDLGLFASIAGMVTYGDQFYFSGNPVGSPPSFYTYDGVLIQELNPGEYSDPFVWNDRLYLAFVEENYGFYSLLPSPDHSLNPAVAPLVEYASEFTDAGNRMYFVASEFGDLVIYSYDGSSATPVVGSPLYPRNLTMFNEALIFTGNSVTVNVCDVSTQSCGLPGGTFAYDGTSFSTLVGVPETAGEFVDFQGRLYFTDGDLWKYIEPTTLADTGNDGASVAFLSAASALALALGIIIVTRRRGALP